MTDQATDTPIRFLATETVDGEIVAMEVSPKGEIPTISSMLANALDALDAAVDKTPAPEMVRIATDDDYEAAWAQVRADKVEITKVEETLQPFANIAFRVHRTITGKINEYKSYAQARIGKYDPAIVDYDKRKEDERKAEEDRIRESARREDEERRAAEIAEAKKRGDKEEAERLKKEKPREIHVSVGVSTPKIAGGRINKRFVAHVEDEEQFIIAVGRPQVYREVAAWLEAEMMKSSKTKHAKEVIKLISGAIKTQALTFPTIPFNMVEVSETAISKAANVVNGKIDWPGIVIEEDRKTSTRTR